MYRRFASEVALRGASDKGAGAAMSAEQMTSLMQRKARTARDAQAARAMSLGRALRLAAAKQAEQLMGLALNALGVIRKKVDGTSVRDHLAPETLILLLDGPNCQVGAAILDPAIVTGLMQQQIMGKIKPAPPQGEPRLFTATDAALCAPFVEAWLAAAALLPEEEADCDLLKGYRFGVWAKEPRQAQLALDAADFEAVEVIFDMAGGVCTGKFILLLPHPVQAIAESAVADEDVPQARVRGLTLGDTVMDLHADLTIALTRLKMPLQTASALKVGDLLDLNLSSMAQALILDGNGRAVSRGTLGQIDGVRAVQVEQRSATRHTQPRRRVTDREGLDLPDVTQSYSQVQAPDFMDAMAQAVVPSLSDVDIFGDLDDLPELPDLEKAELAADARMTDLKGSVTSQEEPDPTARRAQTEW